MNNRRKYKLKRPMARKTVRERKYGYTDKASRDIQYFIDMVGV